METKYERLQRAKQNFRELMPILRNLSAFEQKSFIHLIMNRNKGDEVFEYDQLLLESMCSTKPEAEMARLSEESNYALKNRYRHQKQTM
jgi:hypothetical protein